MPNYRFPPWRGPQTPLAPLGTLRVQWNGRNETVQALLDTGADYTQIPLSIARALGLRKVGEREIIYADGIPRLESHKSPTYRADVEFDGAVFRGVLVSGDDSFTPNGEPWALIGRDILNRAVVLDGPRRVYTVTPDASTAR